MSDTTVVVVGVGACGSLVAQELAAKGFSVIVLEAGKRFEHRDLANSEANIDVYMAIELGLLFFQEAI